MTTAAAAKTGVNWPWRRRVNRGRNKVSIGPPLGITSRRPNRLCEWAHCAAQLHSTWICRHCTVDPGHRTQNILLNLAVRAWRYVGLARSHVLAQSVGRALVSRPGLIDHLFFPLQLFAQPRARHAMPR